MSLSVLMTTYNCAPFIWQAIKSILIQTYKNFELLIVDDGSTDNTEEIVRHFHDGRIRYIKRQHFGMAAALNFGMLEASNDFISLMDADDISDPYRLEKQIASHSKKLNEINFTSAAFFKNRNILFTGDIGVNDSKFLNQLRLHGPYNNATALFNKRYIIENGGFNESLLIGLDHELWLRLKEKSIYHQIADILYFIRFRESSLTYNHFLKKKNITYSILEKYYNDLQTNFNIDSFSEQNKLKGWREYFYGSKSKCRQEWSKLKLTNWDVRILIAYLISFLPEKFFSLIKKNRIKLRMRFWISIMKNRNNIQKRFDSVLNDLSN